MKRLLISAAMLFAAAAILSAQSFPKPVKDKATKLYGYQNEAKEWVISPQFFRAEKFDKSGLAKVTDKNGRDKIFAVINPAGEFVLPFDCLEITIDEKRQLIQAERCLQIEDPDCYDDQTVSAWGVYSLDGQEIFAPRFRHELSFNKNDGRAVATDKGTLKQGVVDWDGNVLIPFDFYNVSRNNANEYTVLDRNMKAWDINCQYGTQTASHGLARSVRWMPEPYEPEGDLYRALAYGKRLVGKKVYANRICRIALPEQIRSLAVAQILPFITASGDDMDWGVRRGNFIRFEPFRNQDGYTIGALVCNADGKAIATFSEWGCFIAETNVGYIYEAEGRETYFISKDINWQNEYGVAPISGYSEIDNGTVEGLLGLSQNDIRTMHDYWKSRNIFTEVELAERTGYLDLYGSQLIPGHDASEVMRQYPFLGRKLHKEQFYSIKGVSAKDGKTTVTVKPEAQIRISENYGNGFSRSKTETLFWGVNSDRYIRIIPVVINTTSASSGMLEDKPEPKKAYTFQFDLYEDDGTFIRTIGTSKKLDLAGRDIFGFRDIGFVFSRRPVDGDRITFTDDKPYTGTMADLKMVDF